MVSSPGRRVVDNVAPMSETFTVNSIPAFLRGRLRRSYALVSKPANARATRRSAYRLTFHQYLGVSGLGIGVSSGHSEFRHPHSEEILFVGAAVLEVLVNSVAGEKERKLPDNLLKYLQLEKKEFVRDWMRGFINLENDDEEFRFSVDFDRCDEKDIWIEYIGMFDGSGRVIGDNMLAGAKCSNEVGEVPIPRIDMVV